MATLILESKSISLFIVDAISSYKRGYTFVLIVIVRFVLSLPRNEPSSNPGGSTLSFNRDFGNIISALFICLLLLVLVSDQKVKISLMPQRRSFGSGCSWRDAANTSSNKPTTPVVEADEQSIKDDSNTDPQPQGGNWYNQHGGPTRVIDHVPYRSRQGNSEWKPTKGNAWRGRTINDEVMVGCCCCYCYCCCCCC